MSRGSIFRIGVDTGGTFTDFVVVHDGRIEIFKELSTPRQPDDAIMSGIGRVAAANRGSVQEVVHGSTVATNALLERKGARTALLTTSGFEDVIVIGRQTRRDLYNILVTRPEPLVPDELRFGVRERVIDDGSIEVALDRGHLQNLLDGLQTKNVESIAVSLLYSFANPEHENIVFAALEPLGVPISLSSRILPEYREYERTSTTVINAYLAPLMSRYLLRLRDRLEEKWGGAGTEGKWGLTPLTKRDFRKQPGILFRGRGQTPFSLRPSASPFFRVMQSNGGAVHSETAAASPVRTILSGPAGGVVGAFHLAQVCGYAKIITFDMGGTSTDVSLCEDEIKVTHESQVDGMPVGIPMMDIHTVGAGGGSIAHLDPGGALKVGPESAGADPGPICYGKGERLTVTDANLILGRLRPEFFLGGTMQLAAGRIPSALAGLEWTSGWKSAEELAQGVIDVVNNNMEQAIRLISVERGYDPRDFTLFCFGGAGGLHAASLARSLGMRRVVVPQFPGALSALGLLLADVRKDYSQTLLIEAADARRELKTALGRLHKRGLEELHSEGFRKRDIEVMDLVDLRYRGQSYELTLKVEADFISRFHEVHQRRYGYANPGQPVELVNVRSTFLGRTGKPEFKKAPKQRGRPVPLDVQHVWIGGSRAKTSIYDRARLGHGHVIQGPAIIGEYSSTTLVPRDFRCSVDGYLNLVLE